MSQISFKNSFENQLISNLLPLENKQNFENDEIDILIEKLEKTSKSISKKGQQNPLSLSILLDSIKIKINEITSETFDKFAVKLFNKIIEIFKETIHKLSKSEDQYTKINLISINKFLANFYLIFSKLFQNYNEAHKNVVKNSPNFLKIYFKLFEENLNYIIEANSNELLKSFLTFLSSIMHTQTNMLRPFEIKIENIVNKILCNTLSQPDFKKSDKDLIEISIALYSSTIYLTNDINKKFPLILKRCVDSLNYYMKLIEPVSIKNKKGNLKQQEKDTSEKEVNITNNISKENNFTFFFDNITTEISSNCLKIKNAIKLIYKILKSLLLSLNSNSNLEFNFKGFLGFLVKNLFSEFTNLHESEYIISGLSPSKFNLIISYKQFLSLKMLRKIVELFSPYMIYYIPLLKDVIKSLTIFKNENKNEETFFEFKKEVVLFVKILLEKFDLKICVFTKEFVQKIAISEFTDVLICYLEKKDKTIIKIDKGFFKLSSLNTFTNKHKNKKVNNISLLDIAKQETFNTKLENYSEIQLEDLIINYLNVFIAYISSETFIIANNEEKSQIRALIDLICFPSYSKFIFSLKANLKSKMIYIVNLYISVMVKIKKNSDDIVTIDEKLILFLRNFYHSESTGHELITSIFFI